MKANAPAFPRHQPYDLELEAAVLGSMLVSNRLIDIAAVEMDAEILHEPLHQRLFSMFVQLMTEGGVTPLIVWSVMKTDQALAEVGGMSYLVSLAQAAPALPDIPRLAKILRDLAVRRQLARIGGAMIEGAHEPPADFPVSEQIQSAEKALTEASETMRGVKARTVVASEIAMEAIRDAEAMAAHGAQIGVTTGLASLDKEIGRMQPTDLILLAGRSGMGKSTCLGAFSLRSALLMQPTLIFSIEMSAKQWTARNLCDLDYDVLDRNQPLWYSRFRNGTLRANEYERALLAQRRLEGLPLEICDEGSLSIEDIAIRARAFKRRFPGQVGLVVIDYLQKVRESAGKDRSREQQVTHIATGAKNLAKTLEWPVLAGSQINRQVEQKVEKDRRPVLADLRESGSLENEADTVLMPYWAAYYVNMRRPPGGTTAPGFGAWKVEYDACKHTLEMLCRKNRHGRTFELDLFADMAASVIRDHNTPAESPIDTSASDAAAGLLI